ncbi:hypothetical protein RQW99_01860 [Leuconostoc falkenbergense]|uniref:hypothetical protein n=1 Tax=Leuconostoc falkenbergense TaxID=2766470 RepID=UPI002A7F8484|nr:hypothetical protein [Leuconostoc falkenbergense]MDY5163295.1 hypothetical protein [Leuconostoc falkenbergense]
MSKSADLEDIMQSLLDYVQAAISKGREAIEGESSINYRPIDEAENALKLFERISK